MKTIKPQRVAVLTRVFEYDGACILAVTPLVYFPHETFTAVPFAPTLEGQYIIKNVVLLSAGLVIGAVVRGGRLVADPENPRALLAR